MSKLPIYITGNEHKAKFLAKLLGIELDHHKLSLDEIQSADPREVIEHKVRQAHDILQQPVLVEDTCMGLDALGGLPGTFIKFFIEQENGAEKICRMADGFEGRRATATVTFGYYDGETLKFFQSAIYGEIAQHPGKEINGFGWDRVFVPDGYDGVVRSELTTREYDELYLTVKPIKAVQTFLQSL